MDINRIVLIGNGFDLAHGLPTSYQDFIRDYWSSIGHDIEELGSRKFFIKDDLLHVQCGHMLIYSSRNVEKIQSYEEFNEYLKSVSGVDLKHISTFLEIINDAIETYGWVDIENLYYTTLKDIIFGKRGHYSVEELNKDLNIIKLKLQDYLTKVSNNCVLDRLPRIHNAIYSPLRFRDCSIKSKGILTEFARSRCNENREITTRRLTRYRYDSEYEMSSVKSDRYQTESELIDAIFDDQDVPLPYMLPGDIVFLNFNYTNTSDIYLAKNSEIETIHIHGELGNNANPIVFGYGDEMDEDYKKILSLNDNSYLEKSKSNSYLETDNYKRILRYMDSAPFQVVIIGHSCGNSDRTLLNTIFEHPNCISIKPCYYQKDDGTDNFRELTQNISRNFNDMARMRDVVACKEYCDRI
ncbi:MAG: hypothetical protein IKL50_06170 [Bacteroidales bacterium]|nr:hypothetical protein [Bacteroidales bacterium]